MAHVVAMLQHGLAAKGWRAATVFPDVPGGRASAAWFQGQGLAADVGPVASAGRSRPWSAIVQCVQMARFLRRGRWDVVAMQFPGSCLSVRDILAVRMAGIRCVAGIFTYSDEPAGLSVRWSNRVGAFLCRAVVVPSQGSADFLIASGVPRRTIRVVHNGVPIPAVRPSRAEARRRLDLDQDAFVVCTAGRLAADKGMADLVKAVAAMSSRDTVLLIAGDGPERDALEVAARSAIPGRARFAGWVEEGLSDIYAAADVFVLASRREAFGLVYQEAAMHRLPLIGCDIPGTRESIVDGETGILVAPGNIGALAAAIARLKDDASLRRSLGEAARARALARFTEAHMVGNYDRLLREVLL